MIDIITSSSLTNHTSVSPNSMPRNSELIRLPAITSSRAREQVYAFCGRGAGKVVVALHLALPYLATYRHRRQNAQVVAKMTRRCQKKFCARRAGRAARATTRLASPGATASRARNK